MNMPGFTAAAALSQAGGAHQALSKFTDLEVDKVLPQKAPQTICGHGSGKYFCWYTCCTITYIGKYNVPVINCSTENICAHPGQGVFR